MTLQVVLECRQEPVLHDLVLRPGGRGHEQFAVNHFVAVAVVRKRADHVAV
jgi:hypothetical protein